MDTGNVTRWRHPRPGNQQRWELQFQQFLGDASWKEKTMDRQAWRRREKEWVDHISGRLAKASKDDDDAVASADHGPPQLVLSSDEPSRQHGATTLSQLDLHLLQPPPLSETNDRQRLWTELQSRRMPLPPLAITGDNQIVVNQLNGQFRTNANSCLHADTVSMLLHLHRSLCVQSWQK